MRNKRENFIRAETNLRPVSTFLPDLNLYVADESTPLWQETEYFLGQTGLPPPFWAFAWAGGQALARFILDNPSRIKDKYILDFACGSGLVGIAAMKAGARKVLACDIDYLAVSATELNAKANAVQLDVLCADLIGLDDGWDVILVGDICYERETAEKVIQWLETLRKKGREVLIGDPGRSYLPQKLLTKIMCYMIPTTKDLEDSDTKESCVWQFLDHLNHKN